MTPNDLDAYLAVLANHSIGAAVLRLGDGVELHVTFVPSFPVKPGTEPEPGGWKSPDHLDNPLALRDESEYRGSLP